MNKEQQIEELAKDINNTWFVKSNGDICGTNVKLKKNDIKMIAHQLVLEGYRKTFTSDFASDTQKAYKEGYIKGIEEIEAEIEILKIQNKNLGIALDCLGAKKERMTERLKQILLSIDTVKEMNAMCNIDEQRKQAVKEFAEKLQKELPCRDYTFNGITFSMILTSSMKYVIDKLLKEYEK